MQVPLLKKEHTFGHHKFANGHLNDSEKTWEKLPGSDETNIELFSINSTCHVWRMKKCEYNPNNSSASFFWGGFYAKGTESLHHIKGPMNRAICVKVLKLFLSKNIEDGSG